MMFYSTNNRKNVVSITEAVLNSLPKDKGLYMPVQIPVLAPEILKNLHLYSFKGIAYAICRNIFSGDLSEEDLEFIIEEAINFPAPLVSLDDDTFILELFHGPSLAFKDFGARFMARLMSILNKHDQELTILVATSGDTGGAVASGFLNTPGIKVHILYPSGKVSHLQEKQLTTLGGNINAFEVDGTFDDCQRLVKEAFLDEELNQSFRFSSANSINIARLVPQSFYYFEAFSQLLKQGQKVDDVVFVIPSGNYGNLTAGAFAKKMGLPVSKLIAATNVNNIVPEYLRTGSYTPRVSKSTISNAMDVGNPSNFVRLKDLYSSDNQVFNKQMSGFWYTDEQTRSCMKSVYEHYQYIIDPHGAVGYLAWRDYQRQHPKSRGIILETAHPSKFKAVVEKELQIEIPVPKRLSILSERKKVATAISSSFSDFKDSLMATR